MVDIADSALPVSIIGPLGALLDGYHKLRYLRDRVNQDIQQPGFDQEERVDWAMDWSRDDSVPYETAEPSGSGAFEPEFDPLGAVGHAGGNPWGPRQRSGRRGERQSREETGFVPTKRYTKITNPRTGRTRVRNHDGEHPTVADQYMEVKTGQQGLTERTLRQIRKDALMIHRDGVSIRWRFHYRRSPKEVSQELLDTLKNYGIPYDGPTRLQ